MKRLPSWTDRLWLSGPVFLALGLPAFAEAPTRDAWLGALQEEGTSPLGVWVGRGTGDGPLVGMGLRATGHIAAARLDGKGKPLRTFAGVGSTVTSIR